MGRSFKVFRGLVIFGSESRVWRTVVWIISYCSVLMNLRFVVIMFSWAMESPWCMSLSLFFYFSVA